MRGKWTNLILHTIALIHRRKTSLLTSHSFQSILDIFVIIILELFLAIISFPLYLTSKESNIGGKIEYKIRRIITLFSLLTILIIWLIKLFFITLLPFFADTRQFFISSNKVDQEFSQEFISQDSYRARISDDLSTPEIISLQKIDNLNLILKGSGEAGKNIILNIGDIKKSGNNNIYIKTYIDVIDENGLWEIRTDAENFDLVPGNYWLQVFTYDSEQNNISSGSPVKYFQIERNLKNILLTSFDIYLNYIMIVFLSLGILAIILII